MICGLARLSLLPFLFLVLISCAKEEVEVREEFSTPEKTYRAWLDASERGDMEMSMRCLTEPSRRLMEAQFGQMEEFKRRLNANMATFRIYSVTEQKIKKDQAVVLLKGPGGDLFAVPLRKEAEGWKVDMLSLFSG